MRTVIFLTNPGSWKQVTTFIGPAIIQVHNTTADIRQSVGSILSSQFCLFNELNHKKGNMYFKIDFIRETSARFVPSACFSASLMKRGREASILLSSLLLSSALFCTLLLIVNLGSYDTKSPAPSLALAVGLLSSAVPFLRIRPHPAGDVVMCLWKRAGLRGGASVATALLCQRAIQGAGRMKYSAQLQSGGLPRAGALSLCCQPFIPVKLKQNRVSV